MADPLFKNNTMSKVSEWVVRYSELRETYNMTESIDKLVEEVAASLNRQGWTRVEDAPKDGTEILGYDPYTESIYIVWWNRSMGDGCWNCASNSYIPKISLWMPLPNKTEPI